MALHYGAAWVGTATVAFKIKLFLDELKPRATDAIDVRQDRAIALVARAVSPEVPPLVFTALRTLRALYVNLRECTVAGAGALGRRWGCVSLI